MQLIWKELFSDSSRDHGTRGQLCSLLKRLPATKKPKDDMHVCTDALFKAFKGYIVAAACKELGIDMNTESLDSEELKGWSYELQAKTCTVVKNHRIKYSLRERGGKW